jgi:hypothetical protein
MSKFKTKLLLFLILSYFFSEVFVVFSNAVIDVVWLYAYCVAKNVRGHEFMWEDTLAVPLRSTESEITSCSDSTVISNLVFEPNAFLL